MTSETRFLLNDRAVTATEPAGELVLDWLRKRARQTGTKEGCKEGDCGACAVLVGTLLRLPASGTLLRLPASGTLLRLPASGTLLRLPASGGTSRGGGADGDRVS